MQSNCNNKSKTNLTLFDDLFQTDESREDLKREKLSEIPISLIQDFPDHPYQVRDDEDMDLLIDSIKSRGLIQPILVRPIEDGKYEMVSGHRRKRAFELIGIEKIPARVQELTRDEAILSMVDSNLQREEILPSEKAFAYKMRMDALKRQAGRPKKENVSPVGTHLRTDKQMELETGDSRNQIHRYIRLTHLIKPILNLVDEKLIGMRPAVEISYLSEEQQKWLYEAIEYNDATPSHDQTLRMRKFADEGRLSQDTIDVIMDEQKPNQREKSPFRDKRITSIIPKSIPVDKHSDYVVKAVQYYNRYLERLKDRGR